MPFADGTVLFDPVSGRAHVLDPAAGRIWAMLAGPTSIEAIAGAGSTPEPQVRAAVEHLVGEHLVVGESFAGSPVDEIVGSADPWRPCEEDEPGARVAIGMLERTVALVAGVEQPTALIDAVDWLTEPTRIREPAIEWYHLDTVDESLRTLPSRLNRLAARSRAFASVHAGGVVFGDAAVLLPAASGAGKSTLVTQLVCDGAGYLSDEVVGIAPRHLGVSGYTKRISLELGSWPALPATAALAAGATRDGLDPTRVRWIDPRDLHPDALAWRGRALTAALIVVPRYEPGAPVALEEVSPYEAIAELLAQASNLASVGGAGVRALCAVAQDAPCYRLVHGDAVVAAAAVRQLATHHGLVR